VCAAAAEADATATRPHILFIELIKVPDPAIANILDEGKWVGG
jgi:hypothetical protein